MLSNPELAFCIYQNHKEKHCVDLVNILAMIDNGKVPFFMTNGYFMVWYVL